MSHGPMVATASYGSGPLLSPRMAPAPPLVCFRPAPRWRLVTGTGLGGSLHRSQQHLKASTWWNQLPGMVGQEWVGGHGWGMAQVAATLQGFYWNRLPRTAIIQFLSRIASDLIISSFDTPFQVSPPPVAFCLLGDLSRASSVYTTIASRVQRHLGWCTTVA